MELMKLHPSILVLCVIAIGTTAQAQSTTMNASSLMVEAPKLIRLQNQFEQTLPPGVSIEAKEVSRKGTPSKDLEVRYNIYVKGIPAGTVLRQLQWPVDREKPIAGFSGITLDENGRMICAGRTEEQCHNGTTLDSPIQFTRINPLKGEPFRSVFIATDLKIPISLVPDPVESTNAGCTLSAIRLTPKFELAIIHGSGFPPESEVHLQISNGKRPDLVIKQDSAGNMTESKSSTDTVVKADKNGFISSAVVQNPEKTGQITVDVVHGACAPKLAYKWGVF
jgi:hypothetical protein